MVCIYIASDDEDFETSLPESSSSEEDLPLPSEDDATSPEPSQSSEELNSEQVTWTGFGELVQLICILANKYYKGTIRIVSNLAMAIVRLVETTLFKFIVRPLFYLWYSLSYHINVLISSRNDDQILPRNSWDDVLEAEDIMQKTTRSLLISLFMCLSACVYYCVHPEFSFTNTYDRVADPSTDPVGSYCDINEYDQRRRLFPNSIKHALSYQNHVADINAIDRHLSSIDFKLSEQSRSNDNFFTKAATDLGSLKKKQSKLVAEFNDFHIQLGLYRTDYLKIWKVLHANNVPARDFPKEIFSDLVRRLILQQKGVDSKFAPEVSKMMKKNQYFRDLTQKNGATVGDYLLQETKKLMRDLKYYQDDDEKEGVPEESNPVMKENDNTVYKRDIKNAKMGNYALAKNEAKIYFKRTSSSDVNPEFWVRFLFGLAPLTERHAIKVIEDTDEDCWTLHGPIGYLGILLGEKKLVKYISITHTSEEKETAPNSFEIYGISRRGLVSDEEFYIGEFQYNNNGQRTQYFRIQNEIPPARIILFRFKSNWGNQDRTDICKVGIYA